MDEQLGGTGGSDLALVPGTDFVRGELLVTLKPESMPSRTQMNHKPARFGVASLDAVLAAHRPSGLRKLVPSFDRFTHPAARLMERTFLVAFEGAEDVRTIAHRLRMDPTVERVELNRITRFELFGVPRFTPDPSTSFSTQWNLDYTNDQVDIDAPEAWAIEKGDPNLIIGIFDEGTQINPCYGTWILHSDLTYHLNSAEDVGQNGPNNADLDSTDADDDGWLDNVVGINAYQNGCSNPFLDRVPVDWLNQSGPNCPVVGLKSGHGIATGGVAAGQFAGTDVVGIAQSAVHYAKFSLYQSDVADMAAAVMYLAERCDVVNMSFGAGHGWLDTSAIATAFTAAAQDPELDCLFIAATGNDGDLGEPVAFPARHPDVMAVGSMTQSGVLWPRSQWTPGVPVVDVVAPVGDGIPVNKHTDPCPGFGECIPCDVISGMNEIVENWSGTSFAAPQASGIAALIRSRFPSLDQFQVRDRIKKSAEYYWSSDPNGLYKYGSGKVNAYLALTEFGQISQNTTWGPSAGTPDTMIVSGDLVIDPGVTLTIASNTVVLAASKDAKHNSSHGVDPNRVEIIVRGALSVGSGVVFASYSDTVGSADWYGIRYLTGAQSPSLTGVHVRNAYRAIESNVALSVTGGTITDGTVGIWSQSGATVTGTAFQALTGRAIRVASGSATVTGANINRCAGGIHLTAPSSSTLLTCRNTEIDSATINSIEVEETGSGQASVDLTRLTLTKGSGPGVLLKFGVTGTVDSSSISQNAVGLHLQGAGLVTIDSCVVNQNPTGIRLDGAGSVTIKRCNLQGSTSYGIHGINGGSHTIKSSSITACLHGFYMDGTTDTKIEWNTIHNNTVGVSTLNESTADLGNGGTGSAGNNSFVGNTSLHVGNLNQSTVIIAENNWWGKNTGPHPSKIFGPVDYTPWRTTPPGPPPAPQMASGPAQEVEPVSQETVRGEEDRLYGVGPNSSGGRELRFHLAAPSRAVRVGVYDVAGRLVRTLLDEVVSPGEHAIRWDGRAESGELLTNGVYFVRMRAGHFVGSTKLVLIK